MREERGFVGEDEVSGIASEQVFRAGQSNYDAAVSKRDLSPLLFFDEPVFDLAFYVGNMFIYSIHDDHALPETGGNN